MSQVYFAKPTAAPGPIKIGCSSNPGARTRAGFNWIIHRPCELLAALPGDRYLERRFHLQFLDDWLGGEWFRESEALNATIEAIRAGTFDADSLPAPRQLPRSLLWQGTPPELFGPIRKGRAMERLGMEDAA